MPRGPRFLRRVVAPLASSLTLIALVACGDDASGEGGGGGAGSTAGAPTTSTSTGADTASTASGGAGPGTGGSGQGGEAGGGGGGGPPVDPTFPEGHPRIYLNAAQRQRLADALAASTPAATRFRGFVDQALDGGEPYDFRGWHAALLHALGEDGGYGELAVATVDAFVASEEATIAGGGIPSVAGDSYLEVGDRVGEMALVLDWCADLVTPEQSARWVAWGNQAVWNVWNHEQAVWGDTPAPWSGWSVDDPVNNYYFSFLRATLLLGLATYYEHPEGPAWVDHFRTTKIEQQLVPVYEEQLVGGGSREGTGYGTAMMNLFRLYDLWEETTGQDIAGLTPHARESIAYTLHAIAPTRDRLAPIGDHARDSTAALFDYHRDYLLLGGALYPDDPAALASRSMLAASTVPEASLGFMTFSDFLYDPSELPTSPPSTLYPAYHAVGTGHVFARSSWEEDAVWLTFISGPYSQSHAHRDQGSFMIEHRERLAYDANVDSQSGIRQEELLHNLVRVELGGEVLRQREGASPSQTIALEDEPSWGYFATDTAPIYGAETPIGENLREILWLKPGVFVVRDRLSTTDPGTRGVYQLNVPTAPDVVGSRASIETASSALDLFVLAPAGADLDVIDWAATDGDMNGGYRIDVAGDAGTSGTFVTVLAVDGALEAASLAGGTVSLTFAGGADASVTFDGGATGGTFQVDGGAETPFGPGVEAWPLTP
jgi:hypothetical protein